MREILFKAKRTDNGEWIEGYYFKTYGCRNGVRNDCHIIHEYEEDENYQIEIETLCQYTGLTDMNGNKIWENDVVYIPYARLEDSYCRVVFKFGQFIGELADTTYDSIQNRRAEVIGNIFDNSELLGGGE